jgi:hypothetical protein
MITRLRAFAPAWAWFAAVVVQLAIAMPFWLYATPAPYHDVHGDVGRGWPFIYGLDQGDVHGDELGPFTTYFKPDRFILDSAAAFACGLPATFLVVWLGRHVWRRRGDDGNRH